MLTDDEIDAIQDKLSCWIPGPEGRGLCPTKFARAIIAAYNAKLLAGVEMPEDIEAWIEPMTSDELKAAIQQYAAAAAAQAMEKALEDAERAVRQRWPNTRYAEAIEKLKEQP